MRSLVSGVLIAAVCLVGCGGADEDERALIPDSDIAAMQQEIVPPEAAPDPASAGRSFYLRLSWGLLAGNKQAKDWVDWSGGLSVSEGTVRLTHLTYFDREDRPDTQTEPDRIGWVSRTRPHFDGVVVRVEVPSDDATITVDMPRFQHVFRATELTGGDDATFPVDLEGHAVSVSSVPASRCAGGFALGYVKPAKLGWMAFAGRTTDRTGKFNGTIRFRSHDDGTISGRVIDLDGREVATVRGTVSREPTGGSFSAELIDENGRAVGALTGLFSKPSYGPRGAFQGSYEQPCSE